MNWIWASLLMFFSSVGLYLFVRKATLMKVPSQYNNLAMFLIPLFIFYFMALVSHQHFSLPFFQFLIIIVVGILFSYLGNLFSLLSIEYAPNPGYSLVISKSYVVFTTLISVVFFKSEISWQKILAILLIVGFSALIMLSQKSIKKKVNQNWLPLAIGSFFCWGFLSLSSKYLFTQGVHVYVFLTYTYLIVSICIIGEMIKKKIDFMRIKNHLVLFLFIGIFSTGFNLFLFFAIQIAPNVGYVNAINASSISAITIMAILLFKDEFSIKKLIGVVGVTAGLLLLLI